MVASFLRELAFVRRSKQTDDMSQLAQETNAGHWPQRLLIGMAVCILISIFLVTQWCFGPYREFTTTRLFVVFSHYFVTCRIWAVLTIPIRSIVNRLGFDRDRIVRTTFVYLLLGVCFSGLFFLLSRVPLRGIGYFFYGIERGGGVSLFELLANINTGLVVFVIIVGVCLAYSNFCKLLVGIQQR